VTKHDRYNASAKGQARRARYEQTRHGMMMRGTYDLFRFNIRNRRAYNAGSASLGYADRMATGTTAVERSLLAMFREDRAS
jgi:hypothetical protein